MAEVVSPPSREWYYKRGDEFVKWQGDLMDKNDIKPSDDVAVQHLREMINQVNQTISGMEMTRNMEIRLFINRENNQVHVSVVKKWGDDPEADE